MSNPTEQKIWSTWEELLLGFAVKRHGLRDWESVAMELQTRCSLPALLTAQICKDKYYDLRRRFLNDNELNGGTVADDDYDDDGGDVGDVTIPWLEELRQLRVAELRQEVQRCDLSIQSLQLKVKTMQEEKEQSLQGSPNDGVKPDLDEDIKAERSENDKKDCGAEVPAKKAVSGEDSDRDNRSFNESNSTENREIGAKAEPEAVEAGDVKPDPEAKPVGEEDSCNDSSDRHDSKKRREERKAERNSAELRDSMGESKEGTKESSDVQSSASLTTRRRRKGELAGGCGGGEGTGVVSPATETKREPSVKSEPLFKLLDVIRSHKRGSLFERRLENQKTDKYKSTIRQHVDLETIQARIDDGSYSACSAKFHLDLLLLFNNAIVFFPKASLESPAAYELRDLVLKDLKKNRNLRSSEPEPVKFQPKPELERSDSLLAQHKSTVPIVVCRKRSSISAKPASSASKIEKPADDKPLPNPKPPSKPSPSEEDSSVRLKVKEKPVTGVRSMRRGSKARPNNTSQPASNNNQKTSSSLQQPSSADKAESAKVEKKKAEANTMAKKRGAADFLKRMKKGSPTKGTLVEALRSGGDDTKGGRRDQQKKKVDERKEAPTRRRGGEKQAKEEEGSPSKRNVGRPPKKGRETVAEKREREAVEKEDSSKRPKKRTRR